jgi:hypothetical protein
LVADNFRDQTLYFNDDMSEVHLNEMTEPENQLDFLLDYGYRSKSIAKKHLHEFTKVVDQTKHVEAII